MRASSVERSIGPDDVQYLDVHVQPLWSGDGVAIGVVLIFFDRTVATRLQREVKRLKAEFGKSVLITDHNVAQTLRVCDRALIINDGRVFKEGTPREIINDEGVRAAYLGRHPL